MTVCANTCSGHLLCMQTHVQGISCICKHMFKALIVYNANTCTGHLLCMQIHVQGISCRCIHMFRALTVYANMFRALSVDAKAYSGHLLYIWKHIFRSLPVYMQTHLQGTPFYNCRHWQPLELQRCVLSETSQALKLRTKWVLYTVVCGYFIYFVCKTNYSGHAVPLSSACCNSFSSLLQNWSTFFTP